MQLTTNFDSKEFATSNGELNISHHLILILQAFRSWLGVPVMVSSGCRYPVWNEVMREWNVSAHNIYLPRDNDDFFALMQGVRSDICLTIPATGADIYVNGMDTWQLMEKVEEFLTLFHTIASDLSFKDRQYFQPLKDALTHFVDVHTLNLTGLGCYPDTNNQCVHVDCGHLSLNPDIRDKRKQVTRWCRINDIYHYAESGESFYDLRGRVA